MIPTSIIPYVEMFRAEPIEYNYYFYMDANNEIDRLFYFAGDEGIVNAGPWILTDELPTTTIKIIDIHNHPNKTLRPSEGDIIALKHYQNSKKIPVEAYVVTSDGIIKYEL
jgi:DNA repair protein RadC